VCPGKVVLLGSLALDVLSFMLHAPLLEGTLGSCQFILSCSNGTFPTIQLPLMDEELLLQLSSHC
jgi:hypothetical protein